MRNPSTIINKRVKIGSALCVFLLFFHFGGKALGEDLKPGEIGIFENLGHELPAHLQFIDEGGRQGPLSEYFDGRRPVILVPAYYGCPSLCTLVFNGLLDGLKGLDWSAGNEFRVVAVSIDPREKPELAAQKKAVYLAAYGRPGAEKGWSLLTGDEESIRSLTQALGFKFRFDEASGEFEHGAALFILDPDGRVQRVLQGVVFGPTDIKFALIEAGAKSSWKDRLLMGLHHFDGAPRKYIVSPSSLLMVSVLPLIAVGVVWLGIRVARPKK